MRVLCKYLKEIDIHNKENRLLYHKLGRNILSGNGTAQKKKKTKTDYQRKNVLLKVIY